jgi:hypothetical protein
MITENKSTRNVWGFSLKEFRLYCFSNKAERTKYLEENKDVEELQAQDSFVADFRSYAAKWGMADAIEEFISPYSPIQEF